jgi:hypothetical protein
MLMKTHERNAHKRIKGAFRFAYFFIVGTTLMFSIASIFLLISSDARHYFFRTLIEYPSLYFKASIRNSMQENNFTEVVLALYKQKQVTEKFSQVQNNFLPGLLENTAMVMNSPLNQEQKSHLRPYLVALSASFPDYHIVQLWLASSLIEIDPDRSLLAAQKAIQLMPSDHRSFKIAYRALDIKNQPEKKRALCELYRSSHFGRFLDPLPRYGGAIYGYNTATVEIYEENKFVKTVDVPFESYMSGVFDLSLDSIIEASKVKVYPFLPSGTGTEIESVDVFLQGKFKQLVGNEQFRLFGEGFEFFNGRFVAVSGNLGAILIEFVSPQMIDRLRINYSLHKPRLSLEGIC